MDKEFDLVVVGDINPDLVLTGDVEPVFGQVEKSIDGASMSIGASSCIFAAGAARLGLKTAFIGKTGDDEFGRFMREQLQQRGVDTRGVVVDPNLQTGLSVILSKGSDRAILSHLGALADLRYEDIDFDLLARARHLHMGAYFMLTRLRPRVPELFARAHQLGLTVSLDTNYDPEGRWDIQAALNQTDIFMPNEDELRIISGENDTQKALEKLSGGRRTLAVKLGARGGVAYRDGQTVKAPALKVDVVDTTGAGDSFDGGFLYGILHGWSLERSLRLACACGSLSTRAAGGTTAQPTLEEAAPYLG